MSHEMIFRDKLKHGYLEYKYVFNFLMTDPR